MPVLLPQAALLAVATTSCGSCGCFRKSVTDGETQHPPKEQPEYHKMKLDVRTGSIELHHPASFRCRAAAIARGRAAALRTSTPTQDDIQSNIQSSTTEFHNPLLESVISSDEIAALRAGSWNQQAHGGAMPDAGPIALDRPANQVMANAVYEMACTQFEVTKEVADARVELANARLAVIEAHLL